MGGGAVTSTASAAINQLRRELTYRFNVHPVWTWPPQLLQAMIGMFNLAFGGQPPAAPLPGFRPHLVKSVQDETHLSPAG
ncbi:hypothetical protein A4G29_05960 [Mycobacterium kansasii]|nr:hypothetical protein A4G29_05960 [Mycobacterium kansasii]